MNREGMIAKARRLWPRLQATEFHTHLVGTATAALMPALVGSSEYIYGLVGEEVGIVTVTQYMLSDISDKKVLEQLYLDIATVLDKDYTLVREMLCAE